MKQRGFAGKMFAVLLIVSILAVWTLNDRVEARSFQLGNAEIKHIILFIGDGMHREHEIAASRYLHGSDRRLSFQIFPYIAISLPSPFRKPLLQP